MIQEALALLETANNDPKKDRWYMPFPMGVFGTLREHQCNNSRMHRGKVSEHRKAFMPHFIAHGLSISHRNGSSAPFEVFSYSNDEWQKMISGVDALEGFAPERTDDLWSRGWDYGYYRTLAWLHLLPDDYDHQLFNGRVELGGARDLRIDPSEWGKYERIPCWVYSSKHQNRSASETGTVIWG